MNLYRNDMGFIDLNSNKIKISRLNFSKRILKLEYLNKTYYYKIINQVETLYNELIAFEIAQDFKIDCVSYDIATYDETIAVISENFIKKDQKYISMEEIIKSIYGDKFIKKIIYMIYGML